MIRKITSPTTPKATIPPRDIENRTTWAISGIIPKASSFCHRTCDSRPRKNAIAVPMTIERAM